MPRLSSGNSIVSSIGNGPGDSQKLSASIEPLKARSGPCPVFLEGEIIRRRPFCPVTSAKEPASRCSGRRTSKRTSVNPNEAIARITPITAMVNGSGGVPARCRAGRIWSEPCQRGRCQLEAGYSSNFIRRIGIADYAMLPSSNSTCLGGVTLTSHMTQFTWKFVAALSPTGARRNNGRQHRGATRSPSRQSSWARPNLPGARKRADGGGTASMVPAHCGLCAGPRLFGADY